MLALEVVVPDVDLPARVSSCLFRQEADPVCLQFKDFVTAVPPMDFRTFWSAQFPFLACHRTRLVNPSCWTVLLAHFVSAEKQI